MNIEDIEPTRIFVFSALPFTHKLYSMDDKFIGKIKEVKNVYVFTEEEMQELKKMIPND